jgi:hypothetical protein
MPRSAAPNSAKTSAGRSCWATVPLPCPNVHRRRRTGGQRLTGGSAPGRGFTRFGPDARTPVSGRLVGSLLASRGIGPLDGRGGRHGSGIDVDVMPAAVGAPENRLDPGMRPPRHADGNLSRSAIVVGAARATSHGSILCARSVCRSVSRGATRMPGGDSGRSTRESEPGFRVDAGPPPPAGGHESRKRSYLAVFRPLAPSLPPPDVAPPTPKKRGPGSHT